MYKTIGRSEINFIEENLITFASLKKMCKIFNLKNFNTLNTLQTCEEYLKYIDIFLNLYSKESIKAFDMVYIFNKSLLNKINREPCMYETFRKYINVSQYVINIFKLPYDIYNYYDVADTMYMVSTIIDDVQCETVYNLCFNFSKGKLDKDSPFFNFTNEIFEDDLRHYFMDNYDSIIENNVDIENDFNSYILETEIAVFYIPNFNIPPKIADLILRIYRSILEDHTVNYEIRNIDNDVLIVVPNLPADYTVLMLLCVSIYSNKMARM